MPATAAREHESTRGRCHAARPGAAGAGCKQERRQHERERNGRMVDEQHEFLQERDLDKQEREPDAREVREYLPCADAGWCARAARTAAMAAGSARAPPAAPVRACRDEQQVTGFEQCHAAAVLGAPRVRQHGPAEKILEVRTIVRRGADIERVPRDEVGRAWFPAAPAHRRSTRARAAGCRC